MRYPLSIISYVCTLAVASAAQPNYEDHILPIFEQSCTNCHNPDKQKGGLDLSTYSAMMRGGSGGKIAEPGEGGGSRLYGVITHTLKPKMPPKGDKLEKKDADLIRAWVDGGLLENKSGKPKKKKKPAFALQAAPSAAKPEKIAIPQHVLLEPVVVSSRSSVVADMVSSPWAPILAVTGQRQVLLYNTDTLELAGVLPFNRGQPEVLSFHPSGKYLLAGGGIGGKSGTTITWDIETGKEVLRAGKDFDSVLAASLRADLGGISLGGPGKRVKLWDTSVDEQLVSIKKHTDWVTQLSYSPDGVLLASGGRGGGAHVWEAHTGNPFHDLRGHKGAITGLAWRSDSNLLATASEDGSVFVWEMNNGKQVKKITAHAGGALSLDWTRDGHLVTSGRDKKVKIWKPDFNLLKELPAFSNMVTEVAFSHDGKRIFAADWSGGITVWDTATQKQVGTIAANPAPIADRIVSAQAELKQLPARIAAAGKLVQEKSAALKGAQAHMAKVKADHRNAMAAHNKLITERTQLDSQLTKLRAELAALQQTKQQRQQALVQARDILNKHNQVITATRTQHQGAANEVQNLTAQEAQLVQQEEAARKQAEANPEDPALQQAAAKAKADLDNHRKKLAEARVLVQQKSTALAQLTQQQQGPGNQLAAADKAYKESVAQLSARYGVIKPVQAKRSGLNKPVADTLQQVKNLEKQIKPAQEKIKHAEGEAQRAEQDHKHLAGQLGFKQKAIKHLQAATINTEAIRLASESTDLTAQQYQLMDSFTALAKEIQELRDPAKLKQKSRELAKLRSRIDEAAPEMLERSQQARAKKQEYMQAVTSDSPAQR